MTELEAPRPSRLRRSTAAVARSLWHRLQALDRRDPRWLRRVPSGVKRRLGRWARRLLEPLVPSIVETAGQQIEVPASMRRVYALDDHESLTRRLLDACLAPGMVAVDGGANIGLLTVQMARRVGAGGRVIAAEPDPANREVLTRNLARNGVRNVEVVPVALGERRERRTLFLGGTSSSLHRGSTDSQEVEVEVVRLDELLSGRLDFVKLDIEGAELAALTGMERLLAANPGCRLLVEWGPGLQRAAGHAEDELPRRLLAGGFRVRAFDDQRGRERPLDEVLAAVYGGRAGENWYVNLLASRGDLPVLDEWR